MGGTDIPEWIRNLHTGDEVSWTDPDDGLLSRNYIIQKIEIKGNIVRIEEQDGSVLECLASELS